MQYTEAKGLHEVAGYLRAIYELKAQGMGGDITADDLIQRMATHMKTRLAQMQAQREQRARQQQAKHQHMANQQEARSRQLAVAQATAQMDRQKKEVHAELVTATEKTPGLGELEPEGPEQGHVEPEPRPPEPEPDLGELEPEGLGPEIQPEPEGLGELEEPGPEPGELESGPEPEPELELEVQPRPEPPHNLGGD